MSNEVYEYYIVTYTDAQTGRQGAEIFSDRTRATMFMTEDNVVEVRLLRADTKEQAEKLAETVTGSKQALQNANSQNPQIPAQNGQNQPKKRVFTNIKEQVKSILPKLSIRYEDLNDSQKKAYDIMMDGQNIYLSGSAGTGKSFLLQKFMADCKSQGRNVILTGSTGIAAEQIGGITIHKACGIPWNDLQKLIKKDWADVSQSAKALMRLADTLVIDEISMIDYATFEYIAAIINRSNKNRIKRGIKPTQLIVVGDFLQLPPVVDDRRQIMLKYYPDYGEGFCFESQAWKDMHFQIVNLSEVMRQSEKEYITALNHLKMGDRSVKKYFNRRLIKKGDKLPKSSIFLFGTNNKVQKKNALELSKLPGEPQIFKSNINIDPSFKGKLNCIFPEELQVKIGARVMAVSNDMMGDYSNGSLGTVRRIDPGQIYVEFDNGKTVPVERAIEDHFTYRVQTDPETLEQEIEKIWQYSEENFPLKLAYAITIHKSQGQTFDTVIIHPSCFTNGQLYVALSRCKTFDGIFLLKEITDADIKISKTVINFQVENNIL